MFNEIVFESETIYEGWYNKQHYLITSPRILHIEIYTDMQLWIKYENYMQNCVYGCVKS